MRRIINIVSKFWPLLLIFIIAIFLRFFRFSEFVMFLGDQGRDAIIVKRILTLEHLPAIGAPTSVGQVYLGPFYYYFIAPWLLFFRNNPVGLAFGVALFSTIFILVNFLIVKELFNEKIAYISTALVAFSYSLIELSRFSWNPNLLPLFTLLTIYFVIKSIKTKKWIFYVLTGAFISFSIQLHYLFLFIIPVIGIIYILSLRGALTTKQSLKKIVLNLFYLIFNFFIFSSPLLVFDLRHQFLNTKNFIKLFSQSAGSKSNFFVSLSQTFLNLNKFSFGFDFNPIISLLILILIIIGFAVLIPKKQVNLKIFIGLFLSFIIFFSFYGGSKYLHYYGLIYPIYFIIIANILSDLTLQKFGKYLIGLFLVAFIFLNGAKYTFLFAKGGNQINQSKEIAQKIFDNVRDPKFTVTALPERFSDSTYRYFLEIWGKRSLEKDSLERANELFVVCEKDCLPIIGNPDWEIAFFAPNKIVGQWKVDGVKIYKLIR